MNWKRRARQAQQERDGAMAVAEGYGERIKELEADLREEKAKVRLLQAALGSVVAGQIGDKEPAPAGRGRWIWMAHPAHYICADRCLFRLNTWVPGGEHGWIVSTVGEQRDKNGMLVEIGHGRTYETMVFQAEAQAPICCPYGPADYSPWETEGYSDAQAAYLGHMEACERWDGVRRRND